MRNPFRSEADAFRFVWLTIGYFALIFIGSLINLWVGIAVFIVVTAVAFRWFFKRGAPEAPVKQTPAASPAGEYRILVVANETVGGPELLSEIRHRSEDRKARLDTSLASMRAAGIDAIGEIGDGDPIQAIEDAVRTFRPDELIISTHPAGRSHWLERGVVEKARERFDLPVTHVVVDLAADRS